MSRSNDLTRWNRAGLHKFEYINGSGPLYLERLKEELLESYKDRWLSLPLLIEQSEEKGLSEEQAQFQRNNELIKQYYVTHDDIGWSLARVFAETCHVLTEHLDAHANEAFLRTATQWGNLRRLVELIDYHPAAATSASTRLVLIAKENRAGIVSKGFQVKYAPPTGGTKVVFETLEDLIIDHEFNELRPKGWNKSDESPLTPGNGNTPPPTGPKYSVVAMAAAVNLQGVGQEWATKLDTLALSKGFRIKDFLNIEVDTLKIDIPVTWLREWKTKAAIICDFKLDPGWSDISDWTLSRIVEESTDTLTDITGNSLEKTEALKQKIEMLSICLDHEYFIKTQLKELLIPHSDNEKSELASVETSWYAKRKPKVVSGRVSMILREYKDEEQDTVVYEAEAARVANIDKKTNRIDLQPSLVQYSWYKWKRSEARLRVSPRWKRKLWLNGDNVIRTVEPHGLTADAYIAWKISGLWQYAAVTEADKRNLRLDYSGPLPQKGTKFFELSPIEGPILSSDHEVIVILKGESDQDIPQPEVIEVPPEIPDGPNADDIFTVVALPQADCKDDSGNPVPGGGGGGLLPPASLPEIGTFLFPIPMLPMDLVKVAVKLMLSMGVMQIPSTGIPVFKGMPFDGFPGFDGSIEDAAGFLFGKLDKLETYVQLLDDKGCPEFDDDGIPVNEDTPRKIIRWDDRFDVYTDPEERKRAIIDNLAELLQSPVDGKTTLFKKIEMELEGKGAPLIIRKDASVKAVVDSNIPRYIFEGSPNRIETGEWVVGEFVDGLRALQVKNLDELSGGSDGESYAIGFDGPSDSSIELKKLYADFRGELVAEGADKNTSPVDPENIELDKIPPGLKVGRKVLLIADGEGPEPIPAKIKSIDDNSIVTDPPALGFNNANLVIRANVVDASHGTAKPVKRLSSGVAGEYSNSLLFNVANVSTVSDSTFPRGVRADLEIKVDDLIWQQVPSLDNGKPTDSHYAVRATEEGFLRLVFGGRRLPTGTNNVSVNYRVGVGRAGNLDPGTLVKIVNPHPLIESVMQPTRSVGGEELEPVEFIRDKAPATLLALERSVSLVDFENLAMSRNDVWQTKAFYHPSVGTYLDRVRVVIVPAGGGEFDNSDPIRKSVEEFLTHHAVPTVSIRVASFNGIQIKLKIVIRVDLSSYEPIGVVMRLRERMLARFTLENRKINQPFYLSEAYQVVEGTEGVAASSCFFQDSIAHQISPETEEQVLYLSDDPDHLLIEYEAYKP